MPRKIVDWSNVAAAAGLGLYFLVLGAAWGGWGQAAEGVPATLRGAWWARGAAGLAGAWLLWANGRLLAAAWRAGGLRERLRIPAEEGAHLFAPEALEDLFLRSLRAEPDLLRPAASLEIAPGPAVSVRLRFGLKEQDDIVRRMEEIRSRVRDRIQKMLPAGVGLEVITEVVEFAAAAAPPPPPRPDGGFNGPVYANGDGACGPN